MVFLTLWAGIFAWLAACTEDTIAPPASGQLQGLVVAGDAPVADASVTTQPATQLVRTDSSGRFSLSGIPAETYTITVRGKGIRTTSLTALVSPESATEVVILTESDAQENRAPVAPSLVSPAPEAVALPRTLTLAWWASDPDGDSLRYEVLLFTSQNSLRRVVAQNLADTSFTLSDLDFATVYFWQVIATDPAGATTRGAVWSFTTQPLPDLRMVWVSDQSGNDDIYASDGSDTVMIRITNRPERDGQPRLSPGRRRLAFVSEVRGESQLFMIAAPGEVATQVTQVALAGFHHRGTGYTWSPDGGLLLYAHYHELYRINTDGSGLEVMARAPIDRHFREVDWTAVGNQIVVQTIGARIYDSELYLYSPGDDSLRLLVGNRPGQTNSPNFSIDGREVLFTHDASEFMSLEGRQLDSRIYRIATEGGDWVDVSVNKPAGTNDLHPRYSPDGAKIIFENAPNDNAGPSSVWIMNRDGSNRQLLYENARIPDWQ